MPLTFGWRIPDFPVDGAQPDEFKRQIFPYLDTLHGHFDAVWVGDHFFPWMATIDQSVDTIEAWTTLTYMLGMYPKFRGGTIVLSQGYRPPALLAKMALNFAMDFRRSFYPRHRRRLERKRISGIWLSLSI